MDVVAVNLLNGVSFGVILFLLAAGLSIIFGLMGILNLAHGALYMVAAYVGYTVLNWSGEYLAALLAGAVAAGVVGIILQQGFLQHLLGRILDQILLTFGFVYILTNLSLWIWGPYPKASFAAPIMSGSMPIAGYDYPVFRLWIIAIGVVLTIGLWWFQDKTAIGARVRAGM
ncbi:MAG TPA: branched-chain amino acid ABC transporter permease, partial [Dehalococcoidia bacterium]|nr:branched-chain amino acid ABC transporter permease [Dehalococcoidia bacterium]